MAELPGEKLETVLVVDDDNAVLNFLVHVLKMANFVVLQATRGTDAVKIAVEYAGKIDLLLSDVRMPEISGPDLAGAIRVSRPDIRVMFTSGIASRDLQLLNNGSAFISKPFVPSKLIEMVKVALHTSEKSPGSRHFDTSKDTAAVLTLKARNGH